MGSTCIGSNTLYFVLLPHVTLFILCVELTPRIYSTTTIIFCLLLYNIFMLDYFYRAYDGHCLFLFFLSFFCSFLYARHTAVSVGAGAWSSPHAVTPIVSPIICFSYSVNLLFRLAYAVDAEHFFFHVHPFVSIQI